jgi:CRP/FNR family transcriptional regulator, anaerobic regulatory protein
MIVNEDLDVAKTSLLFWKHLSPAQQDYLTSNTQAIHFDKGQTLHYGEKECIGVLLVKRGMLRIYITSEEGREITLYRLEEHDICILSASCILKSIDFDVSIDAETDCEVLRINSAAFSKLSSENVHVELFSYKLATERFSDVMWAMQQILFTSFDKRLAAFLLNEASKANTDKLHMTHDQIAKYLGSAREVVSRMLKYFSNEGYVTLTRGGITIIDQPGLRKVSRL